ncbi:MAG: sulfatase-like hydrolase/transferase, partial [Nitrospiraceae bacterium]|nr:sulfatase-like hydrolase/transferase [Nitrospiraceae bacterium]
RPNIAIIMTDQQRADFFRSEGFPMDVMPFMDELGAQGARFSRGYTPSPLCVPARCSLFTGRFPKATRVRENGGPGNLFGPDDLVTILRSLGYSINLAGKNHSHLTAGDFDFFSPYMHHGSQAPESCTDQERATDRWIARLRHRVSLEPTPFPVECQPPVRVVRDAIKCVDACGDEPFFLWLSFAEPHNPYQVSEPYFSMFPEEEIPERSAGPEAIDAKGPKWRWQRAHIERKSPGYDKHWRRYRANYCGMLRLIDDQIRRFINHLEACGRLANTFVIFVSDHGDYAGDYGLQRKGIEMPECLIRVPFIITGPGIPATDSPREDFVSLVDIMPTLCEALGVDMPYGVQGRSLWPMLTGQDYPKDEFRSIYAELGFGSLHYMEFDDPPLHYPLEGDGFDELNCLTMSGNMKMVRMGKWKLCFDMMGRGQLYDLETDPAELNDLYHSSDHARIRSAMLEELLKWTIRTEDNLPPARYVPKRAERNWYAPHVQEDQRPQGHESG